MMETLYYFPVGLILTYILTTCLVFKQVPKSISNTHYMWKEKGLKHLFTFVMWATGLPILIYWISISPQCYQFLPFVSIAAMCFVGAACAFKETLTSTVHYASAGIWASAAVLYFVLMGEWSGLMAGALLALLGLISDKFRHFTFWAEMACVLAMIMGIGAIGGIF